MKLTLTKRIIIGLIILTFMVLLSHFVYAEVPDVSKWSCQIVNSDPDYGVEVMRCVGSSYAKVSGELFYIHEHQTNANKTVYYNALKTNAGNWVETVNENHLVWEQKLIEGENVEVSIRDDNGVVVAKRTIPLLQK